MKIDQIKTYLMWLMKRNVVVYILISLLCVWLVDWPHLVERYRVRILNQIRPAYGPLLDFAKDPHQVDKEFFKPFLRYFNTVERFVKDEPMGYNVSGYLNYYMGNEEKAAEYFFKSFYIQPHFVWPYFNMGRLQFDQKKYKEAVQAFEKGVSIEQSSNLELFYSSIIYRQFIHGGGPFNFVFEDELQQAYDQAYLMIIESYAQLNEPDTMLTVAGYVVANRAHMKDHPALMYLIGKAHYLKKEYPQAAHFLKMSVDQGIKDPDALFFLSKTASMLGRKQESEMLLRQSLLLKQAQGEANPSWWLKVDLF